MEEWTIATPFIDRNPFLVKLWLLAFDRLDFPRKDFNLVLINQAKNVKVIELLDNYIKNNKYKFKSVNYIKDSSNFIDETLSSSNTKFFDKRLLVAQVMQKINEIRKGNLLLIEDDIIPPANAWNYMKGVFDLNKDYYGVTACQISRQPCWSDELLVWDLRYKYTFGENDNSEEKQWETVHRSEEGVGIEHIGCTATGFILYRKEFLDNYKFKPIGERGQDVIACMNIRILGKLVALCWDIKLIHLGYDKQGRIKFFRKPEWETEVIDEYGTRF